MGFYLLVLLFLWFLAINAQNDVLFGIVWGLAALYAATLLWARHCADSLRIVRSFPDRAYTGHTIALETRIRNTGLLPVLWAETSLAVPDGLRVALAPPDALTLGRGTEARLETRLLCLRRGYYQLGALTVRVADPLGLVQRELNSTEARPLIVYPRVVPVRRLRLPAPSALPVVTTRTPLFEDPTRIVGVRAYTPADSLRRIHWPATARMGEPMVKEFQFGMSRSTMLCLDLARPDFEPRERIRATELAIVVAASLASHAIKQERLEVGVHIEGHDPMGGEARTLRLAPRADAHHLKTILELLARVQSVQSGDFAAVLRDEGRHLPWGTTVVVIAGADAEALNETLLHLKRNGHALALIVVSPYKVPRVPPGIALYRVWDEEELATGWPRRRVS
jgi:uncharacterized protein (DUF58 family)